MLTVRANAKINWSLSVVGRREGGYHELDMLMQSISLHDTLTFIESDEMALSLYGRAAEWDGGNLVCRAAEALKRASGVRRCARIDLVKRIPARAGLGGGSADAAAVLCALNELWNLGMSPEALQDIGFAVGADVPFCVTGGFARVMGLGEIVSPLPAPPEAELTLVMPDDGLSTGEVFARWDESRDSLPTDPGLAQDCLARGDFSALDACAFNDLTGPAVSMSDSVPSAIEDMRALGAVFARMSGSGSCCFGVFGDSGAACAALGKKYRRVYRVRTRPRGVEFIDSGAEF